MGTRLSKKNKTYFIHSGRLRNNIDIIRICIKNKIDILHVHFYGLSSTFMVGWFCKTRVINHFHNTLDRPGKIHYLLNKILAFKATRLVGCSSTVRDTLITAGFSPTKCYYITNCIDFTRLDYVKSKSPFNNNKTNILILGTDFYRKGVDIALKAIKPLVEKYDLCLQIVSVDPNKTRDLVKEILFSDLDWVAFPEPINNVGDYYRSSSIFLSPSLAEGLSYAVIESIYCNCMTIKSDISSMNYDLIGEEQITVRLSIENLKNKIESVLCMSNTEKNKVIANLKTQIIDKYSVENWGKKVFNLYKEIAK